MSDEGSIQPLESFVLKCASKVQTGEGGWLKL